MPLSKFAVGVVLSCTSGWALAANPPVAVVAHPAFVEGLGHAVSVSSLAHYSGGSFVLNVQTITGTVTGDSATNVTTGSNVISGNSFDGASGLPSVIQNTGNNVLIQNGVIVNVQLKP